MKILIVEDELTFSEILKGRFTNLNCLVDTVENGEQALIALNQFVYDLIILDLGIPLVSGLEVLKSIRRKSLNISSPVMILSARNSWQERVQGLQAGADDYLGKPFEFEELWARCEALHRRKSHTAHTQNLQVGDLQLDLETKRLTVNDEDMTLTKTEYRLLNYLMQHPNQVFSKEQLSQRISDVDTQRDSNVIEVYIRKLRKKIGSERIETLRGLGYRLVNESKGG